MLPKRLVVGWDCVFVVAPNKPPLGCCVDAGAELPKRFPPVIGLLPKRDVLCCGCEGCAEPKRLGVCWGWVF